VEQYYRAGAADKANEVVRKMAQNSLAILNYYSSLPDNFASSIESDQNREIANLRNLVVITRNYKQEDLNKEIDEQLQALIAKLSS